MAQANVQGVKIRYEDTGAGDAVVFHHGYTSSHEVWAGVVERLRERYRCIVIDARGTGGSDRPESGYAIEQMASDVLAVADGAGIERFTFVGHSMGGVVGMELGLAHASRLEKLVLVAPGAADGMEVPADVRERSRQRWLARDRDAMIRERIAASARESAHAGIVASIDHALSVSVGHFEDAFAALCGYRKGDRLGEIATPTLVVAGAADGLLRANLRDFMRLGNATLHVFSRVGHSVQREVPDELAGVLEDFLEHGVVTAETLARRA
jgi:pimeloyl-ACP methyl ester carboxylesterase